MTPVAAETPIVRLIKSSLKNLKKNQNFIILFKMVLVRLPYQCQFTDCGFLYANSCQEHRLIAGCCCENYGKK